MLIFTLNCDEKFVIHLDQPDDIIHCCYQSQVNLFLNNEDIVIGKSIIADFARGLQEKLTLALLNNLQLHTSIKNNIGYYWNQELNEEDPDLFLIQGSESKYWVGYTYLLWGTDSNKKNQQYTTWIYNDSIGNIIFQVTPIYPETCIDPLDSEDVQAYHTWMESLYKPFFTSIISKEIAQQWLNQANFILQTIKDNVQHFEDEK